MNDTIEIEIPDHIQEFLEPIPGDSATGTDASLEEEFFKLSMEFPKTVPDYKNWIELSEIILKEKSKDIKVVSWLCFAFYRTEKIKGFKDGLTLVYHMLKKFGKDLYPVNPLHKSKAIQFLNTARVTKLIEREEINKSNAEDIISTGELLSMIKAECEILLPGNVPVLQGLQDIISTHSEEAKKVLNPPPAPERKPPPVSQPKTEFRQSTPARTPEETPIITKSPPPTSEDEATVQLRRTLSFFYEYIQNGETKERIPESYFVFGVARQLQWSTLVLPASEDKITNIEPPNDIIYKLIKQWFNENKFDVLIPRIELEFIKDNSEFRYWLDAQRYLVHALENKGGNYTNSANDIKYYLVHLVKRLPELQTLMFSGGEIPFADKETINWLDELSRNVTSGSKTSENSSSILPPIVDASYDEIKKEYDQAINSLPAKFEENFGLMQQKLSAEERIKGKFLRRLNLANFCYEAKQYNVAKVNLEELNTMIDELNLASWEPALSTAVWQSLYLTNIQVLFITDNETTKLGIEKEQRELFNKIAKHNGILAINLEQQKHKRRK
ncbi:MAG: TssA family type VI secretion system protein [Ignavibacteriaceae bacterium]